MSGGGMYNPRTGTITTNAKPFSGDLIAREMAGRLRSHKLLAEEIVKAFEADVKQAVEYAFKAGRQSVIATGSRGGNTRSKPAPLPPLPDFALKSQRG